MRLLCILMATSAGVSGPTVAERLIEAGHWKRARTIVEARIREAPNEAQANFLLSQIRNAFGERATPLALAEKAVAMDGRTAKYHRQVAEVLGVMAQYSGAIRQLFLARRFRSEIDAALALDPSDTQALRDLVEFHLLAPGILGGDAGKAEEMAGRIGRIDAVEGYLARARVAAFRKHTAEAGTWLRKAAEVQPPSYKARIMLAQFYLVPEHPDAGLAEKLAREALKLDSGRADAYCVLAAIYADRSEWDKLESTLAAASREVPDDPVPYYRAADRLLAAGHDAPRAEVYLRAYLGQEPEGNEPTAADARWKAGLALEAEGRITAAIEQWKQSVRLDPESKAARELKRVRNIRQAEASNRSRESATSERMVN